MCCKSFLWVMVCKGFLMFRCRCCWGCRGLLRWWVSMGLLLVMCWIMWLELIRLLWVCFKVGCGLSEGGVYVWIVCLFYFLFVVSWLRWMWYVDDDGWWFVGIISGNWGGINLFGIGIMVIVVVVGYCWVGILLFGGCWVDGGGGFGLGW